MKTLKELKGVKKLSKTEQKSINGGLACNDQHLCPGKSCCVIGICRMVCD